MNRHPIVQRLVAALRRQAHRFRTDERGETTEKVIITALFAALALTVATIITLKVTDKAESIPTDGPPVTQVAEEGGGLGG
ncbi:MAG TPA: hypothetical protein VIR58_12265 [Acidimicrobiales bacterium]|jgi:hypothetical protein